MPGACDFVGEQPSQALGPTGRAEIFVQLEEATGGRRRLRVRRSLDGLGECDQEVDVRRGIARLIGQVALDQLSGRPLGQSVADPDQDTGKCRLEVPILGRVGAELHPGKLPGLPAAIKGVVEKLAAGQPAGEIGAELLWCHRGLLGGGGGRPSG